MNELKIEDIKELVEIPDISLYFFILIIVMLSLMVITLFVLSYKIFKNRKKDQRKNYYTILKELDLTNTKDSAYTMTKYLRLLAQNERENKLIEELIIELEKYKYKKDVTAFKEETLSQFERVMDSIDV